MVGALIRRVSNPGWNPVWEHCVVFLCFKLSQYLPSVSARPHHCRNPALQSEEAPRKMEKGLI